MYIVIYKGTVKPDKEQQYQSLWRLCAALMQKECGALGSTLGRNKERQWVVISHWPNQEIREAAWLHPEKLSQELQNCILDLKNCLESYTETGIDIIDQVTVQQYGG
jgi:quinol monooxygenase YgiN